MAKIRYGDSRPKEKNQEYSDYAATNDDDLRVGTAEFSHPRYEPNLSPDQFNPTLFNLHPGELHALAVDPDYQRQGIARNLVSHVERNHGQIGHHQYYDPITNPRWHIRGDGPPMKHSHDLSDASYPLFNELVSKNTGTEIPREYLKNGVGETAKERNEWAEDLTTDGGGRTSLEEEYTAPAQGSSPANGPIHTRRSGGKIGPSRKRSLNIIPSATQLELPFTDGDS